MSPQEKNELKNRLEWQRKALEKPAIEDLLVDLLESAQQAEYDLCGEQREWHLPRLKRAVMGFMLWFPGAAGAAMQRAKSPYDDPAPTTKGE